LAPGRACGRKQELNRCRLRHDSIHPVERG
jgi:hypothetical protein